MEIWEDFKLKGKSIFEEVSIHGFVFLVKKGAATIEK
jgi:hypothetical protein